MHARAAPCARWRRPPPPLLRPGGAAPRRVAPGRRRWQRACPRAHPDEDQTGGPGSGAPAGARGPPPQPPEAQPDGATTLHLLEQLLLIQQEQQQQEQAQQQQQQQPSASAAAGQAPQPLVRVPSVTDGVNWFCCCALGLLFLVDFTPAGSWLLAGSGSGSGAARLASLQWLLFVLPSFLWARRRGWDLADTFKLRPPTGAQHWAIGLAAGPALWVALNLAIALKTGNLEALKAAAEGAGGGSVPGLGSGGAGGAATLLLGGGGEGGGGLAQVPVLLLLGAVSPAVAEEWLFRGLLLTALQQRLGRVDALAVSAALFALIHLDPGVFFLHSALGAACGAVATASGSVWPAVALHASFNAAAVAAGVLLHGSG